MRRISTLLGLLAAAVGVAAVAPARTAAEAVEPIVDCVAESDAFPGFLRYEVGYSSPNTTPVTEGIGPTNFFSPPPASRGQPTTFLPGLHHRAFSVLVNPSSLGPDGLRWHLGATALQFSPDVGSCNAHGLAWRGSWDPERIYVPGDVVAAGGAAWVAVALSEDVPPAGDAPQWDVLAARGAAGPAGEQGETGPQGERGPRGATGPRGPRGRRGARGPAGVSGYERELAPRAATIRPGATRALRVRCPAGRRPLAGGWNLRRGDRRDPPRELGSYPAHDGSWAVRLHNPSPRAARVRLIATCAALAD